MFYELYRRYYKILDDNYNYPMTVIKSDLEYLGPRGVNQILDKIDLHKGNRDEK